MALTDSTRTSPTLLRRTADWRDHEAWQQFVARYDPYIRTWSSQYDLDTDATSELAQNFWIELAEKMQSFRYDPSRRFRGWLRRCFHWRAVDTIRERTRYTATFQSLDHRSSTHAEGRALTLELFDHEEDEPTDRHSLLLDLAAEVQAAVRGKVHPQSWQAFWHITVDGWTTRQTADALEISYLAAFAAHKRVVDRLAKEGRRRFAELPTLNNSSRTA